MCNCGNCPACRKGLSLPVASKFKPGDVAMVSATNEREPYRAYFDGSMWREYGYPEFCVIEPLTHRPLVVIDPEDREQVERLAEMFHACRPLAIKWDDCTSADRKASGDAMQAALRSLIAPPRPAEPTGLGAVVEDENGRRWTRIAADDDPVDEYLRTQLSPPWRSRGMSAKWWAHLRAVRVLSEGVRDE